MAIMYDMGIREILTSDRHFEQEGFIILINGKAYVWQTVKMSVSEKTPSMAVDFCVQQWLSAQYDHLPPRLQHHKLEY